MGTPNRKQWTPPGGRSWRASWSGVGIGSWSCRMKSSPTNQGSGSQFPSPSTRPFPLESPVHPARLPTLFITHRPEDKTKGLAVVIDARKEPPHPGLLSALQATQVSGRWTAPTSRSWELQGTCDVHGAQGAQSWDQEPQAGTLNYRYRNPSPKRPEDRGSSLVHWT